jgi:hypothetical protein
MSNPAITSRRFRFLASTVVACLAFIPALLLTGCTSNPPAPVAESKPASPPTSTSVPAPAASAPATAPAQKAADPLKDWAALPSAPFEGTGWEAMFNDHDLTGWCETKFAGRGEVQSKDGLILLNMGDPFTGINWTNPFPKMNYEIALDAMRVMGSDFFCGMTVPVGDTFCSLIVGGWGGSLVGISSLDGMDASENETTKFVNFESHKWYRIRLRVTENRIEGWIGPDKLIDVVPRDRKISLRPGEIELSKPMGFACWQTGAALREIKWRAVSEPASPPKKHQL